MKIMLTIIKNWINNIIKDIKNYLYEIIKKKYYSKKKKKTI